VMVGVDCGAGGLAVAAGQPASATPAASGMHLAALELVGRAPPSWRWERDRRILLADSQNPCRHRHATSAAPTMHRLRRHPSLRRVACATSRDAPPIMVRPDRASESSTEGRDNLRSASRVHASSMMNALVLRRNLRDGLCGLLQRSARQPTEPELSGLRHRASRNLESRRDRAHSCVPKRPGLQRVSHGRSGLRAAAAVDSPRRVDDHAGAGCDR
jgi:hypothetical protein